MTSCASAPYPGVITGTFPYNVHYITNPTAAAVCTNVTLHYVSGGTATVNIQVGAFLSPFAPADISNSARYLGDPGSSSGNPPADISFSVNVPASATIALVVWNVNASPQGTGTVYQINLDQDIFCGSPAPIMAAAGITLTAEGCPNMAVDPGETVTASFELMNNGAAATTNLVATLLTGGGVSMVSSGPQNYGVIAPGGMASGSFSFTAGSMLQCGATIAAAMQLSDNGNPLPNVTFNIVTGVLTPGFTENFDSAVAPALPAGWATSLGGTNVLGVPWVTSTTTPNSAPNEAFAPDPSDIGDMYLDSPVVAVSAGGATLTFKNNYNTESTYDGEVLEINIVGGGFNDIITAGGTFVSGGYNATISTAFSSPIAGRMAWSGNSGGYVNTVVTLPPAANGMNVQLRWRMASDTSIAATGAMIDDVVISSPVCCSAVVPSLASAVSRLTHGAAGTFDINLPLTGTAAVEDRNGGGNFSIVLTFNNGPITSGTAAVTTGTGTAGAPVFSGNTMTVPLTGVTNVQTLTLTVSNVNGLLPSASVTLGFLIGDTNNDHNVNSADINQTKAQSGNLVTGTNFREDVNADGNLNSSDVSLVKSKSGTGIP